METRRLALRPWCLEDATDFHRIWGDSRVKWWGRPNSTVTESRIQLAKILERSTKMSLGLGWWAIEDRARAGIIGDVFLQPLAYEPKTVELGYHLVPDAWGHGYATEAAQAILTYGFTVLGLDCIVALVHIDNARSLKVAGRLNLMDCGPVDHAGLPHRRFEARPCVRETGIPDEQGMALSVTDWRDFQNREPKTRL